jgi:hypothetical protein
MLITYLDCSGFSVTVMAYCIQTVRDKQMKNLPPLPESTWEVTFENDSTVFIAARDEAHVRRIIENNGLWRRTPDCEPVKHTIKNIERVTW